MKSQMRGDHLGMNKKISIVTPCYRSENTIEYVIDLIDETMKIHTEYDYEVILVNDGSPDNTFEVISKLASQDEHILAIDLSRNFGQHSALMAGYSMVTGDYVLGMDDDGEHDPREMFKLIEELEKGYDYVCAKFPSTNHSLYKKMGSKLNDWMATKFIGKPQNAIFSSYYVMRRYVVDEIIKSTNPYPYVGGMLVAVTKRLSYVPIEHCSRYAGESSYHFKNSVSLWVNGITAYSVKPLWAAAILGVLFDLFGIVVAIGSIIQKIINPEVLIGTFLCTACILVVGGVIMVLLGLIGEYIGRIYIVSNNIPQYTIRTVINKKVQR